MMQVSTAHFVMHNVLGEPGTTTRMVQYWSSGVLLSLPLLYALPPLRHQPVPFWSVLLGGGLLIYFVVSFATDRLYDWLRRRYGDPERP